MTSIRQRVLDYITGDAGSFNDLALALHAHQRALNAPYAAFCHDRPAPAHWTQIPTVATDVFRYVDLFCGEPPGAVVFRTSGTTHGARGQHHLVSTDVYHASATVQIDRHLARGRALMLAPPPTMAPDSSLSSMLGLIADRCAGALFAWGEAGLDTRAAIDWIADAASTGEPVQVLATSFALVHTLDAMAARGIAARLAPGSILMTTGGYKGKSRTLDPDELDRYARTHLGDVRHVVEYGMTELSSQFWGEHGGPLHGPRWCAVTVHDPETLDPLSDGERGILRFTDLANVDSVVSVQTADLGRVVARSAQGDSLELFGRVGGAQPRGCSLLVDEMLGR